MKGVTMRPSMRIGVIGRGPVSAYLSSVLQTIDLDDSPERLGTKSVVLRLSAEALSESQHLDDSERPDIVIIAETPWKAFDATLDTLLPSEARLCPDIFISSNGYWWPPPARHQHVHLNALSVTAKVFIDRINITRREPADAGLMVGPTSTSSTRSMAMLIRQNGTPVELGNSAEQVVATKCLVNMPLSLNYGLYSDSIADMLSDTSILLSEARQVIEFAHVMQAANVRLIRAPGFNLAKLMDLANKVVRELGNHRSNYGPDAQGFASLLLRWRGERVPSVGQGIREHTALTIKEIQWLWGRFIQKANQLQCPVPTIESLYEQVMESWQ
jgi:hypothetical protein